MAVQHSAVDHSFHFLVRLFVARGPHIPVDSQKDGREPILACIMTPGDCIKIAQVRTERCRCWLHWRFPTQATLIKEICPRRLIRRPRSVGSAVYTKIRPRVLVKR